MLLDWPCLGQAELDTLYPSLLDGADRLLQKDGIVVLLIRDVPLLQRLVQSTIPPVWRWRSHHPIQ